MLNKRKSSFSLVIFALACASTALSRDAPTNEMQFDGIGQMRIGMTFSEINIALENSVLPIPQRERGNPNCFITHSRNRPEILMMFIDDRLSRIETASPRISNEFNIHVGDSWEDALRKAGGRGTISRLDYVENEFTLTIPDKTRRNAIRFSTNDQRIASIKAGKKESVEAMEGCS